MAAPPAMLLIGQSGNNVSLAISIAGLIVASLMMFGVFIWLRKQMFREPFADSALLSIQQIRRLHREGRITDDEFEALRRAALLAAGVAQDKANAQPKPPPTAQSPEPGVAKSPRPIALRRSPDGGLRAPPGYDLTGEPLPGHDDPARESGFDTR